MWRVLAAVAGITLAALLLFRASLLAPRPPGPPAVIARVRSQLALGPVLAAEEALRRSPSDPQVRLRLARACADSGDPAGAALALFPLVGPSPRPVARSPRLGQISRRHRSAFDFAGRPVAPSP